MKTRILYGIAAAAMMMACSSSSDEAPTGRSEQNNEVPEAQLVLSAAEHDMVNTTNDFSFKLLNEAGKQQTGGALVVSPLSAAYLLGMLNEGAQGDTQREIMQALGFANASALDVTTYLNKLLTAAPALDRKVTVDMANALYGNSKKGVEFSSDYAKTMTASYQAQITSLDFSQPAALQAINQWCSEQTHGLVSDILAPQELKADAMALLLNTVYFKAPWAVAFDKSATKKAPFTTTDGTTRQVDMMSGKAVVGFCADNTLKAISMPYGDGTYQMAVVMTADESKHSPSDVVTSLTAARWQQMTETMTDGQQQMDVMLPRFKTESKVDLVEPLMSMGMTKAFSSKDADFSRMLKDGSGLYVSKMLQKACIEVSEDGTEAAAASAAEMELESAGTDSSVFKADRPFVYVVYEKSTGAIFFIGTYDGR